MDLGLLLKEVPQYRQGRDIVLVDQRGTGNSNPLRCDPLPGHRPSTKCTRSSSPKVRETLEKKAISQNTPPRSRWTISTTSEMAGIQKDRYLGNLLWDAGGSGICSATSGRGRTRGFDGGHRYISQDAVLSRQRSQASLDLFLECVSERACHAAFPTIEQETGFFTRRGRKKRFFRMQRSASIVINAEESSPKAPGMALYPRHNPAIPFVIHSAAKGISPLFRRVLMRAGLT